jgi:endonuclease I
MTCTHTRQHERFRNFLLVLLILQSISSVAQPPPHYYDAVAGLSGQDLLGGLHQLTTDHVTLDYYALYDFLKFTDCRPDGTVWDIYSDIPGESPPYFYTFTWHDECGYFNGEGDCFDREHTWPKSWFGGQVYPMYSDLFIVYPVDGYVNSCRSNLPYGEVDDADQVFLNGSRLGQCVTPGYSGIVFEPLDEYKGDLARTFFYVSARYYSEDGDWPGSPMATGSRLKPWALALLLRWSGGDPVSGKEIDRNDAVFQFQYNRNPFIDHPEFVNLVWGYPQGLSETAPACMQLTLFPNPAGDAFSIRLPEPVKDPVIRIISSEGKTFRPETTVEKDRVTLNIRSVPRGIYVVILITEKGVYSGKLIKK